MKKGAEQLSELNLVFEDEEVEKKSDAIAIVSSDLQFGAEAASAGTRTFKKDAMTIAPTPKPKGSTPAPNVHPLPIKEVAAVTPVAHAAATQTAPKTQIAPQQPLASSAPSEDLHEKMRKMEIDTQVKVLMAEFKTDILTDLLSDIKLLEYQMGGLLNRMYGKHPDLKQEILMLKKLLADFAQKKRK